MTVNDLRFNNLCFLQFLQFFRESWAKGGRFSTAYCERCYGIGRVEASPSDEHVSRSHEYLSHQLCRFVWSRLTPCERLLLKGPLAAFHRETFGVGQSGVPPMGWAWLSSRTIYGFCSARMGCCGPDLDLVYEAGWAFACENAGSCSSSVLGCRSRRCRLFL